MKWKRFICAAIAFVLIVTVSFAYSSNEAHVASKIRLNKKSITRKSTFGAGEVNGM